MLIINCYHSNGTMKKDPKTGQLLEKPIDYNNYVFTGYGPKEPDDKKEYIFGDDKCFRQYKVPVDRWNTYAKVDPRTLQNKNVVFYEQNKKFIAYQEIK